MTGSKQTVSIDGRRLQLSNLDKVLYPETGTTKGDVLDYYRRIAPVMLPHCRGRAATRKRWPDGIEGTMFFQKDVGDGPPEWVRLGAIAHSDHVNRYPVVDDVPTLVWLAQLAALEIHVPQWRFGPADERRGPDRLVLDLDPGPGTGLRECAEVARLARGILSGMGMEAVPVTSGSKGIHLYAPLDGRQTSEQVSGVARELARALEADHPDGIVSSMRRSARAGKVFIDWSQNNGSKTTIAPYSLRGRATPTVAAPRTWRELASPRLKHLDYREVLERVKRRGDPMSELEDRASEPGSRDRLSTYRAKRDGSRTPEPIPETAGRAGEEHGPVFVIQRHDARRLHHDFRIEHDGVLVSWALPKGVPDDPKRNHLAVPTEDHPMEYRFFEGRIPKGEYGAGTVEIWDSGHAEIEKWREDEVIVTLTGAAGGGLGGRRRYALFRTKDDPDKPQWMIHLMGEPAADAGGSPRPPSSSMRPMLATRGAAAGPAALDETEWAFEMKWDGIRAIVEVSGDDVRLHGRSGAAMTTTYPELAGIGASVMAREAVLDGEIVAFDERGAPSFGRLQQRMNLSSAREIDAARPGAPVSLVLFDVLRIDGRECTALPYRQRRELLDDLVDETDGVPLLAPPAFEGTAEDALRASRELRMEGIMAKRRESVYRPGARSADWLKFPLERTAEAVVIGWRISDAEPDGIASLLLAIPHDHGLLYAGRVGTGFTVADRRRIRDRLLGMERKTAPVEVPAADRRDARWVTPRLVGEVAFRERTAEGRLRHPVWRGWRPDKRADEVAAPEA